MMSGLTHNTSELSLIEVGEDIPPEQQPLSFCS